MDITGKNVLITGSTRGIGKAVAHAFAKEGANVILNGRKPITEEVSAEFAEYQSAIKFIQGDISSREACESIINEAEEQLGAIDILVNNAGITNDKLMLRMTEEDFTKVVDINLTGTFNLTQLVIKKMIKKREGTIINMASVSGVMGNAGQANYSASKAGVIGLTKAVAREVASRGVTCNAIAPGFIATDMSDALPDKVKEATTAQIPLGRFGDVQNVADTAIFLAKNDYLTGQVINVDGGLVMNG